MQKEHILSALGLSKNESMVYLALLELSPALVSHIAKHTSLHRPTIYNALRRLKDMNLVTITPSGKQKRYVAESPDKLRLLYEKFAHDFNDILPILNRTYSTRSKRPLIKFLEGKKGIKFVFEDIVRTLKKGQVYYRYSSRKDTTRGEDYLPDDYRQIRDAKKIQRFVITSEPLKQEKKPNLDRAVKAIPASHDFFQYDITQLIYDHKIAYVDYGSETAFIVENAAIATQQRKIFELL